ncbi:MAG: sulfatase-like hydrolase/transferase [Armatimonadota bacterium]|nr:sulfatase-like hydrolase/transferase [Armatimonadota bacterium]
MARLSEKPNVVVCLCDQLRAFELGCYGNEVVKTPNIDRLAAEGVRFEIACSNNPVCTPGRSILISGQYSRTCQGTLVNCGEPVRERIQLPEPTLAEILKQAGYKTALVGKWHIAPAPEIVGFDFAVYPHHQHRYTGQTFHRSFGEDIVVEEFGADYEVEELARFIRQYRGRPFFLFHNISQPHMPLADMPERFKKMYSPDEVPLRPNVYSNGKAAFDENWFRIYLYDYLYYEKHLPYTEEPLPDGFDLRHLTALYYGSVSWADEQVGALVQALEEAGVAEDTIIVFTSDHGDNLGSHQLFNKDQLYEESIRIPLIIWWPRQLKPRKVSWQVASLVDIFPTVLSLVGVDAPGSCQGTDLSTVTRGQADVVGENCAFIETSNGAVGIRTLRHIYGIRKERTPDARTSVVTDERFMFFDVVDDPYEMENLVHTEADGEVASRLRRRVLEWDAQTPWKR